MSGTPPTELVRLSTEGDWEKVEAQWMASVEQGQIGLDDYWTAAEPLIAAGRVEALGALLAVLLESRTEAEPDEELVQFSLRAVAAAIADQALRSHAAKIFTRAGRPELAAALNLLKSNDGEKLRERVLRALQFKPGGFVNGTARVGPEKIIAFHADSEEFELTNGSSERKLSVSEAAAELTPLPDDDFRGLLRFDVARLKADAEERPGEIVESALRSSKGRLEWTHMKKLFARGVVPPNAFARWWRKTRGLVERNPMIQVYGEKEPVLILRTTPISHEEELAGNIERADSDLERVVLVMDYLESIDQGHGQIDSFLTDCAEHLIDAAHDESTNDAVALLAAATLEDIRERLGGSLPREIDMDLLLRRGAGFAEAPVVLGNEERARLALFFLREHGEQIWPQIFASALSTAPGKLADLLARELLKQDKGEELAVAIQSILTAPDRCGEGLFWLWKAATAGSLDDAPCRIDRSAITLAMLRLMDRWARSAKTQISKSQKSLLAKMRSAMSSGRYKAISRVLGEIGDDQALAFYHTVKENQGITDAARHHLSETLKTNFHDVILGHRQLYEEDVIYVSPRGLKKRQQAFDQIVNVDMLKNSEAIGHAADFGDLSENAEFTAALEQRDFLSRRANEIGEEIRQAELIPVDQITVDMVNVGTRIRVRDVDDGSEESITFLGPWDADLDRAIYSYKAPFSQNFLGHKIGDVVESTHGDDIRKLEIISVELAEIPE